MPNTIDNMRGSTLRVVEENEPLNNKRGVTYRVINVDGGGSIDYTKVVSKTKSMPVADADNFGIIYMFDGTTDATYTHGYIYENVATTTSSSASAAQTVGSSLSDIVVDLETLESFTGWTTDNSLQIFYTEDGWSVDTTSLGVTYTGTPNVGDAITITYTAAVITYAWTRVDVQPAGSSLPSQTGNAGKFLTTDGTDASWGTALANKSTASRSLVIGDDAVVNAGTDNVAIGYHTTSANNSSNVAIGAYTNAMNMSTAIGYSAAATASTSTAIGRNATANSTSGVAVGDGATAGEYSTAIGKGTKAGYSGTAVGMNADATNYNVAIGNSTRAGAYGITIAGESKGYRGGANAILMVAGHNGFNVSTTTSSPARSIILDVSDEKGTTNPYSGAETDCFYLCFGTSSSTRKLYKIFDGTTGLLDERRIAPTTGLADGTYVLKMTIVDGTPTLSWVAE